MAVSTPRAGRVAILGTSLVQQNHSGSDTHIATSARGWMSWAEVLSHGRINCPIHHDPAVLPGWEPSNRAGVSRFFTGLNFGVSGQKAIEIERRVERLLAEDFDLIVLDAGTNDMLVETKEHIADTRARIAAKLLAAGKTVILLPILSRGTQKWSAGGPERAKAHWINQMGLAFASAHPNCHVFDWNAAWVDPASSHGQPHDGYSNDGTHFSVTGGFAVGQALVDYLCHLLPKAAPRRVAPDDRFDPIHNPLGNLVSQSTATLTAGRGTTSSVLAQADTHTGPGTWLVALCDIAVPEYAGLLGLSLRLTDTGELGLQSIALAPFLGDDGQYFPLPSEAWSGTLRTPPLKLRPGTVAPTLTLDVILQDGAQPLPLSVENLELRPILSPVRS